MVCGCTWRSSGNIITIVATLFEFSYIPTTWVNSSSPLFVFPSCHPCSNQRPYILHLYRESNGTGGSLSLILGSFSYRPLRRCFPPSYPTLDIIWNTVFSIGRSWTRWKDIYAWLPKRIYAKLLVTKDMEVKYKPKVRSLVLLYYRVLIDPIKVLVSQIWNAIIISMYREHLLSIDHVQKLLYHQIDKDASGRRSLQAPPFLWPKLITSSSTMLSFSPLAVKPIAGFRSLLRA